MPVTRDEFREALSRWASGVAIVTSRSGARLHGMTVSAFASASLDPPLVVICADKSSDTQALIAETRVFAVNVLAQGQDGLSNRFASKQDEDRRFEGLETVEAVTGAPVLSGSLVSLDCRVVGAHDAGDHVIYLGQVEAVCGTRSADPLLYYRGAYRALR